LIVIKGADEGKQFDLTGDLLTVGRDASNRVRLHDTEVSRRHAEFVRTAEGFRLLDVGSANGTFVNSQSVRDVLLRVGDQIQIGQTVLVFGTGRGEAAPPSDLADHISLITRQDLELPSAIVKTIADTEGSRILTSPEKVEGPWLKNALANLRAVYEATQAVSHILDLNQLLERIMEVIFRTLEADRGCIMLRRSRGPDALGEAGPPTSPPPAGGALPSTRPARDALAIDEFEPKAVRWREGINRQEKIPVSRTVMDYVLREKQGILVSDAARDERFSAVQSLLHSGVREVICVPMKGRHETLGVLYLDTRTSLRDLKEAEGIAGKFTADHLALAIAIAHQAALAVEETRYYQAMVQAERLAAIGQTIAAMSHHIKNILQGLLFGSDIVKRGLAEKDESQLLQGWKIVEKNQGKIYDLVMDMLSYSKEREPVIEETNLNAVARDVLELLSARAAEKGVALEAKLNDKLPTCPADPEAMHRALLNVVGNALDAVEDRPEPRVTVETSLDLAAGWLRVQVADNGVGIEPDKLADVFRPFVSTKGAKGTGLGLAVSGKILREHGGDIVVQSQPGKGSTFTLRLPLRSPLAQDHAGGTRYALPPVRPPAE
jgi:signal transduction histidine kinase